MPTSGPVHILHRLLASHLLRQPLWMRRIMRISLWDLHWPSQFSSGSFLCQFSGLSFITIKGTWEQEAPSRNGKTHMTNITHVFRFVMRALWHMTQSYRLHMFGLPILVGVVVYVTARKRQNSLCPSAAVLLVRSTVRSIVRSTVVVMPVLRTQLRSSLSFAFLLVGSSCEACATKTSK